MRQGWEVEVWPVLTRTRGKSRPPREYALRWESETGAQRVDRNLLYRHLSWLDVEVKLHEGTREQLRARIRDVRTPEDPFPGYTEIVSLILLPPLERAGRVHDSVLAITRSPGNPVVDVLAPRGVQVEVFADGASWGQGCVRTLDGTREWVSAVDVRAAIRECPDCLQRYSPTRKVIRA